MLRATLVLVTITLTAAAQTPLEQKAQSPREQTLVLLKSELMELRRLRLLDDAADALVRYRLTNQFVDDVNRIHNCYFMSDGLALTLANILAAGEFSDEKLTLLTTGILDAYDAAHQERARRGKPAQSDKLRNAVSKIQASLVELGITDTTENALMQMLSDAVRTAGCGAMPIPLAHPEEDSHPL